MTTKSCNRGSLELTFETYLSLTQYLKSYEGQTYYTSYPIVKRNAPKDILLLPDGQRINICF